MSPVRVARPAVASITNRPSGGRRHEPFPDTRAVATLDPSVTWSSLVSSHNIVAVHVRHRDKWSRCEGSTTRAMPDVEPDTAAISPGAHDVWTDWVFEVSVGMEDNILVHPPATTTLAFLLVGMASRHHKNGACARYRFE